MLATESEARVKGWLVICVAAVAASAALPSAASPSHSRAGGPKVNLTVGK
jgi:hypothetical protein